MPTIKQCEQQELVLCRNLLPAAHRRQWKPPFHWLQWALNGTAWAKVGFIFWKCYCLFKVPYKIQHGKWVHSHLIYPFKMEFTRIKVYLPLVVFMHSILLLKSVRPGGSQRMQDQNLNESKWNSICSAICLNSAVLLSKLNSLISHSYLPHRERGERGQYSTGGNHYSSIVFRVWQFSPAKDPSQGVQVVPVKDFLHVMMMRFCLWIFLKYFLREIISIYFSICF